MHSQDLHEVLWGLAPHGQLRDARLKPHPNPGDEGMLQRWSFAYARTARNLFLLIGSGASIACLVIGHISNLSAWGLVLLGVIVIFMLLLVCIELVERPRRRIFRRGDTDGISRYMRDWIEHGGRVAIWTRDLSWANDETSKELLLRKAENGELVIFLTAPTSLTEDLDAAGAEVYHYGAPEAESPRSRFTIANYERDGGSVAVGRALRDTHVIDEFHIGDHPAYHMAEDLARLARSVARSRD